MEKPKIIFEKLEQDAKTKAIYSYCKHMNCFGLESVVDNFLSTNDKIFFDSNGKLILIKIN